MMHKFFKNKKRVYCCIALSFVLVAMGYYLLSTEKEVEVVDVEEEKDNVEQVVILPQDAFFKEDLTVEIKSSDEMLPIYFTLDGSLPSMESECYKEPLHFISSSELQAVVIRASVLVDGELSKPVTQTYFIGDTVDERFSTHVVSIVTDESNLYDYEKGIFVEGKIYDDWLAAGGDPEAPLYKAQTNFGQRTDEWVRDAHVEVFTKEGLELVDIDAGISVGGSTTARYPIKSINIRADEKCDEQTQYCNFVELGAEVDGKPFSNVGLTTNSVRLRNGGNDFKQTMIRQGICNELAIQSGLDTASVITPVITFINGEYYSLLQAQNNFTPSNLGKMLSLENDKIVKLGENEKTIFNQMNSEIDFRTADFNDPAIRAEFEKIVDIDEFILYNAIQILISNGDWPTNNYKAVLYSGEYMEGNPYSDGKVHPLFFGSEFAFRLFSEDTDVFELMFNPNLEDEEERNKNYIIKNMMNYEQYKHQFVNKVCDLLATSFEPDNVVLIFEKYYNMLKPELPYFLETDVELLHELANNIDSRFENMRDHTYQKLKWLLPAYLGEYFGASAPYQVYASIPNNGGTIVCNTVDVAKETEGTFVGTYYQNYPIEIQAQADNGYEFSCFMVNGEEYDLDSIVVTSDFIKDGELCIEAYFEETTGEYPVISAVSADGTQDWIELTNNYLNDIDLSGLFLSDDKSEPAKSPCPEVILSQGESIRIVGRKSSDVDKDRLSFAISDMETIYLSDGHGNILDYFFVPRE